MPRNPIARPIERAGCRPSSDGGTGAALRGHDRNDGLPPYRPPPLKPAATWIAGPPVLLVGKMNARRIPAERPKGLAYPLTCLLRWSEGPWAVHESRRDSVPGVLVSRGCRRWSPGASCVEMENGAPGRARTSCLRFRKPPLCPDELRELGSPEDAGARPDSARSGCVRGPSERRRQSRIRFRPILEIKSEVPSPFARALPERPVFEARGYRYCGT